MLLKDMVNDVTGRLGTMLSEQEFAGEVIEIGNVKIIPMLRMQLGFGGTGADGDSAKEKKKGRASGNSAAMATMGAVSIRPVGVVVFTPKGVRVLQVKERRPMIERVLDTVPETIERIKGMTRRVDTEDGILGATSTEDPPSVALDD